MTIGAATDYNPTNKPDIYSSEEQIALASLKKYNPDAKKPHVFNIIPNFLGGILCLIEIGEDQNQKKDEWLVLVKNGRGTVYYDYEQVLLAVPIAKSTLAEACAPNVVLAAISVIIVLASVVFYALRGTIDEPFRAALTAVLAFWFGKSVPQK